MSDGSEEVTIVITTYNNNDFTRCCLWAIRNFFPNIKIILVDGGTEDLAELKKIAKENKADLIILYDYPTEHCRNAAVSIVKTPLVLFMDNDTKILSKNALFLSLDVFIKFDNVAQTGAYALKIIDKESSIGYVGNEFTDHLEVTGFSAYFSLHKVDLYKKVGGMKINEFIYPVPKELWEGKRQPGWTGDFNIGNYYSMQGLKSITPKEKLPVLHWGKSYRAISDDPVNDWCYENWKNIRCNPLNDWQKMEEDRLGKLR